MNGIFLILFSDHSSTVYRITTNFCVFILYSAILLNLLNSFLFNKSNVLPRGSFDFFSACGSYLVVFLCLLIFVVVKTGHLK